MAEVGFTELLATTVSEIDQELQTITIGDYAEWPPKGRCPAYYELQCSKYEIADDPYVGVRFEISCRHNDEDVREGKLIISLIGPVRHTKWYDDAILVFRDRRELVKLHIGWGELPLRLLSNVCDLKQVFLVTKDLEYREVLLKTK